MSVAISEAATSGRGAIMNWASALAAAKRIPAGDDPAWKSRGVRWGDGATRCGPFDRVALADVMDAVNLREVPVHTGRAILQQRAVVP